MIAEEMMGIILTDFKKKSGNRSGYLQCLFAYIYRLNSPQTAEKMALNPSKSKVKKDDTEG